MIGFETELAEQIREIYRQQPNEAYRLIEALLEKRYAGLPAAEKIGRVKALATIFQPPQCEENSNSDLRQFLSLLLGQPVEEEEIDDAALQDRACRTLNTVFERLNQLLNAMQLTVNPGGQLVKETIRHFLKDQMVQDTPAHSLEEYIDQIRETFFSSIESARQGHQIIIEKILSELDPQTIMARNSGGLRIGPLKKAEAFNEYMQIYNQLKKWHSSGRGLDEFIRAFENHFSKAAVKSGEGEHL